MKIFIPRVPKTTTTRELEGLVAGLLDKKFHFPFTARPAIETCDVLQFRDGEGLVEYHGLVSVSPDQAGSWLISHFKGQRLHNEPVFARQFMQRNRSKESTNRSADRRRSDVQITKVITTNPKVTAIDQFRRDHSA
ncbi:hypothetical protein [Sedimenticola selenatireducens]|jgi:hypothetical protein|uniref:Uncharacterized protein n=1 Tax=Sedimenticola selenatireducens TaxID=191960 RepID=A0A558DNW2_9GAMM|nr:hypothetical protein [Sedimenticola selenatireducens]TVO78433.1 hypothetical protein FHP88_01835 [Sedimenticola selenatireducens]TVT62709.1 MAG: hypothetical protein FHK78_13620 [Sedimenticola selenatireducens]